jgi:hypothetical protein
LRETHLCAGGVSKRGLFKKTLFHSSKEEIG